jgi:hypothetical protein
MNLNKARILSKRIIKRLAAVSLCFCKDMLSVLLLWLCSYKISLRVAKKGFKYTIFC